MLRKFVFIVILILIVPIIIFTKPPEPSGASLSGYVLDSASKETLIGVSIVIKGPQIGAKENIITGGYTNKLGFFSISNIPAGNLEVIISYIGYKRKIIKLDFDNNKSIRKDFELSSSNITTNEVVVNAQREEDKREISISKVDIPINQLKAIRIGGESDIYRSLQYLPGVLTSSQISSGLFVRGGSPDQNLVLVDGSTVYNPTHLFGFISTFNSNAIKDVELIKGGFPAEYGGRLSAVLNITQKNGNRDKYEGLASIGAIASQFNVEGPLPWSGSSFFLGGRRTYLEIIKGVYDEFFKEPEDFPMPDYHFYDLNGKITQDIGSDDKLFLSGFMSSDALQMSGFGVSMNLDIANKLLSARWTHIFSESMFSTLNVSGSNYINNFSGDQSGYTFDIENSITDYTIKGALEWFVSDKLTAKVGFEDINYIFSYNQDFAKDTATSKIDSANTSTDIYVNQLTSSIFAQLNYNITELLTLQAGLRLNYWQISDTRTIHPRIALRYQFDEDIAVKAAWGLYDQNLRLASQPDFTFFDTWLPTDNTVPPSSSEHFIISIEDHPYEDYILNFDVYYKKMNNINELNRTALRGDVVSDVFYIGNAESYGVEIFLQKSYGKFTGWLGYALGYINSQFDSLNYGITFRPKYDRRHDFKVVGQYQFNDKIDMGASFVFQSGQSYTGVTSWVISKYKDQSYGSVKIVESQLYGLRLPPSHQLNVNASYKFTMFDLDSRVILDIYNVYNRRDIWFRYFNTRDVTKTPEVEDVRLLPIIPTFSLEVKF